MISWIVVFTFSLFITYPIWGLVLKMLFRIDAFDQPKHIENPFGAVTRDSYGTMVLPDKKSWDNSPEFYAAQCEVDDYIMDKTKC